MFLIRPVGTTNAPLAFIHPKQLLIRHGRVVVIDDFVGANDSRQVRWERIVSFGPNEPDSQLRSPLTRCVCHAMYGPYRHRMSVTNGSDPPGKTSGRL
jgi:hypothetical protein